MSGQNSLKPELEIQQKKEAKPQPEDSGGSKKPQITTALEAANEDANKKKKEEDDKVNAALAAKNNASQVQMSKQPAQDTPAGEKTGNIKTKDKQPQKPPLFQAMDIARDIWNLGLGIFFAIYAHLRAKLRIKARGETDTKAGRFAAVVDTMLDPGAAVLRGAAKLAKYAMGDKAPKPLTEGPIKEANTASAGVDHTNSATNNSNAERMMRVGDEFTKLQESPANIQPKDATKASDPLISKKPAVQFTPQLTKDPAMHPRAEKYLTGKDLDASPTSTSRDEKTSTQKPALKHR